MLGVLSGANNKELNIIMQKYQLELHYFSLKLVLSIQSNVTTMQACIDLMRHYAVFQWNYPMSLQHVR